MADPKYANLPGIAYDQPDVYETTDLPEADQPEVPYEEENEAIERGHLYPSVSFLKFKDKHLISDGVDFSDRLKKGPKRGYDARSGDWELAAAGEKETPLQKFQRLRCEVNELEEEISKLKESITSGDRDKSNLKHVEDNYAKMASEIKTVQSHLSNLRLEELLGAEVISSLQDPQGTQLKKLMSHLDEFQKKGPAAPSIKTEAGGTSDSQSNVITYQLHYRPEQVKLSQTARLAELEQRLHKLETALGSTPEYMKKLTSETHEKCVLDALQSLSAKFALLEPSHVEHVDALLAALGVKMENLSEKAAAKGQTDLDRDKKISELYDVVIKTEPVTQLLPQTIERLIALESLHRQAGDFAKALSQLETVQTQLVSNLQENKTVLDGVQKSFAENIGTIKGNIATLERRIAALTQKK